MRSVALPIATALPTCRRAPATASQAFVGSVGRLRVAVVVRGVAQVVGSGIDRGVRIVAVHARCKAVAVAVTVQGDTFAVLTDLALSTDDGLTGVGFLFVVRILVALGVLLGIPVGIPVGVRI